MWRERGHALGLGLGAGAVRDEFDCIRVPIEAVTSAIDHAKPALPHERKVVKVSDEAWRYRRRRRRHRQTQRPNQRPWERTRTPPSLAHGIGRARRGRDRTARAPCSIPQTGLVEVLMIISDLKRRRQRLLRLRVGARDGRRDRSSDGGEAAAAGGASRPQDRATQKRAAHVEKRAPKRRENSSAAPSRSRPVFNGNTTPAGAGTRGHHK